MSLEWKDKPVKYLRDNVVDQLKWNLANNHLELDEFEQLVTIALDTQSKAELVSLTADLPPKNETELTNQEQQVAASRDAKSIVCILSESKRTGIWVPPKHLRVVTVLGDTEIDFREVQLEQDVTYISLGCWLGALKIIVPPAVNLVSNVKAILGAVENDSQGRLNPDAPTLVIEGKVILGEVTMAVQK
jgi:hypothetical protein